MSNNDSKILDFLYEWAVWGNLVSKKDIETILLKGHLMLEMVIDTTLSRNGIPNNDNNSFYRKLTLLEKDVVTKNAHKNFIIASLRKLNLMRNKLAHEVIYNELETDVESWSKEILENLKGEKYSRYTYRTKIVHSFSILAANLLKIKITDDSGSC